MLTKGTHASGTLKYLSYFPPKRQQCLFYFSGCCKMQKEYIKTDTVSYFKEN